MSQIIKDLELFNELAELLLNTESDQPVAKRIEVEALYDTLNLSLEEKGIVDSDLKKVLGDILVATPKTATSLFFNQLFGGRQGKAILGDLLAVLLNNSMYTYKVAGPQVGIEKAILRKSCDLVGYGTKSGGTFPTGGSMSNYMALIMARDAKDPEAKDLGTNRTLVIYTSAASHYSNAKNASFAGIGRKNVRYIPTDSKGKMIPAELEKAVEEDLKNGYLPTYVNATAGTTVMGAFDPIAALADICEKHNIWLHVDGAYMGGVLFSEQYKHLLEGVDRADSFSYNAHKMLGTPLTCSIILVKDQKHLNYSFSNDATYLYQTDGDDFNLGKTSFQCGRRNDALKFWTLWKSVGTEGLAQIIDHQLHLADVAREYIENHPDYTLYSYGDSISICFNYKGIDPKKLCTSLYEDQITVVGFGSFQKDTFVRFVTINANNSPEDILHFFKVLEEHVASIY